MRPFYFLQLFGNSYILSRRKIRKRKCFLFFFFENRGIKEYFSSSLKRVFTKLPKNSYILANQKNNNMREKICFFLLPSENRRRKFVQLIEGTFVSKEEEEICFFFFEEYKKKKFSEWDFQMKNFFLLLLWSRENENIFFLLFGAWKKNMIFFFF